MRQITRPPAANIKTGKSGGLDVIQRNLQPLCRDTGRSRAIVSGWLVAAALAILVAWRRARRAAEDELIDVV